MGAVAAADAHGLIHPHGLLAQLSAQHRLHTGGRGAWGRRGGEGQAGVGGRHGFAPLRTAQVQRVTTSSMVPSTALVCSATWKPSSALAARMVRRA